MQVVISSSFESAVGLSQLAQLAAAVDLSWAAAMASQASVSVETVCDAWKG